MKNGFGDITSWVGFRECHLKIVGGVVRQAKVLV